MAVECRRCECESQPIFLHQAIKNFLQAHSETGSDMAGGRDTWHLLACMHI